jgi:hypothetical protein
VGKASGQGIHATVLRRTRGVIAAGVDGFSEQPQIVEGPAGDFT